MKPTQQIVITGASSGIGAALVQALAAEGHHVYACARRADKLHEVTKPHSLAQGYRCDVSQEESVRGFIRWLQDRAPQVDALIHCVGGFGAIGPVLDTDSQEWLRTIHTNLGGTYLMVKHIVPLMERSASPRIITFSGGGAFSPFPHYSAYAASKAAVVRLTEILALELAPRRIAVNAVAPGFVATEIHDATLRRGPGPAGKEHYERTQKLLQEGAVPVEVPVACVRFMLSEQAAGLTGKTISAGYDPWGTPTFHAQIRQISQSPIYTLQRINLEQLPESDELRQALARAQQEAQAARLQDQGALK